MPRMRCCLFSVRAPRWQFEDAYALTEFVAAGSESIEAALHGYEELRQPRTARVQIGSRERAGKNHLSSPIARVRRDIGYCLRRLFRYGQTPLWLRLASCRSRRLY